MNTPLDRNESVASQQHLENMDQPQFRYTPDLPESNDPAVSRPGVRIGN